MIWLRFNQFSVLVSIFLVKQMENRKAIEWTQAE